MPVEDVQLFTKIANQICANVYEESGNDYSEHIHKFRELFPTENGQLKEIYFGGMDFEVISPRLFKGLDVSHVTFIDFATSSIRILEEGTLNRFESLEKVRFEYDTVFDEFHVTDEDLKRIRFENVYLQSDDELAAQYVSQFVKNYKEQFGKDISDKMNYQSARNVWGFKVRWGELTAIRLCVPIPILKADFFDGIDVSQVWNLRLNYSQIEEIKDGTFDHFTGLRKLELNENKLTKLPRISDERLQKIQKIIVLKNPGIRSENVLKDVSPNYKEVFFNKGEDEVGGYFEYGNGETVWYEGDRRAYSSPH